VRARRRSKQRPSIRGNCADVQRFALTTAGVARTAYLVYESRGLFSLIRTDQTINGQGEHGGTWVAGDAELRKVVEEIDPATLVIGTNSVKLCSPATATQVVAISNLSIGRPT